MQQCHSLWTKNIAMQTSFQPTSSAHLHVGTDCLPAARQHRSEPCKTSDSYRTVSLLHLYKLHSFDWVNLTTLHELGSGHWWYWWGIVATREDGRTVQQDLQSAGRYAENKNKLSSLLECCLLRIMKCIWTVGTPVPAICKVSLLRPLKDQA